MTRLTFIPDTNFFIQCKTLDQIAWSELPDARDDIVVVITKPVANEIDKHKNQGKGRLQSRARRANSNYLAPLFKADEVVVRESAPRVRVVLDITTKPTPELGQDIDYAEPDNKLVGIAHAYAAAHPEETVHLLSNDTPALLTARTHGVDAVRIPEGWFLQDESDERDKELAEKNAEIERLRNVRPRIKAAFHLPDESVITTYESTRDYFPPLTKAEIAAFMGEIKQRYPMATDYGDRVPQNKPAAGIAGEVGMLRNRYTPATDTEIRRYIDTEYPKWLEDIEESLTHLHLRLEHQQRTELVCVQLENYGTQPARDALITFAADGDLFIMPPQPKKDDQAAAADARQLLPKPPKAPKGVWSHGVGHLVDLYSMSQRYADMLRPQYPEIPSILPHLNRERDANEFFHKKRPMMPVQEYELECAQWRHSDARTFRCQLHVPATAAEARGVLAVTVQAENLIDPVTIRLPTRLQRVQRDTAAEARKLLNSL